MCGCGHEEGAVCQNHDKTQHVWFQYNPALLFVHFAQYCVLGRRKYYQCGGQ